MKTGILGGTFNPVHLGHILLALEVREKLKLDEVLFIPTGDPPHKTSQDLSSAKDRYEMVKLAISGYPFFKISSIEIDRKNKSYTIDTIRELKKQRPGDSFYFIIGLDAFMEIGSWKESAGLLNLVHFIVVSRPGSRFRNLADIPGFESASAASLKAMDEEQIFQYEFSPGHGLSIVLLWVEPVPVSSSEIRENIRKGKINNKFLPDQVKSYIIEKKVF
ncbi:MAG TPA: nicotinate-nucleotide adenylyltransferase [Nitrospiria bacterium]|nr:nicotinate-nucleotide adenylyltransferase [Nitrospiria bacterium]